MKLYKRRLVCWTFAQKAADLFHFSIQAFIPPPIFNDHVIASRPLMNHQASSVPFSCFSEFLKCHYRNGCCVLEFQFLCFFVHKGRSKQSVRFFFFLLRHTTAFMSRTQSEPRDNITHSLCTRKQAPQTELIHSKQKCPYSPTTTQMYPSFVFGRTAGAPGDERLLHWLCFLTESLSSSGWPSQWSGPIRDYPPQLHKLQNGFIMSWTSPMS